LFGTETGGSGSAGGATSLRVSALVLGSVVLGLGGYYVGARSANHASVSTSRAIEIPSSKPVYGTPEDFARAIEELKTLFSEEAVTTAEDQLEAHGFSHNSPYPGMLFNYRFDGPLD
jgi:D-lactate dehydrogenase (cytochrome)